MTEPGVATDLASATWPDVERKRSTLLLVPLGATEQHGHHLPLATDTLIAVAWAEGVARAVDGAVVAPALPYGSSGEHRDFPGTLSIGGPALRTVVIELVRSAAPTFRRVAFLSGHAGNEPHLHEAVTQLRHEGHDATHLVPAWPGPRNPPIDAHAGRTETSLLLHLRPDLIDVDLAVAGETRPLDELMERLVTEGVAAVSPSGVLGDASGASAEEGRRLLAELIARTATQLST